MKKFTTLCSGELITEEAASLLFISSWTFLRKRNRYEEEDFDGTFDRRLGKKPGAEPQKQRQPIWANCIKSILRIIMCAIFTVLPVGIMVKK
ncbi:hypothetical protein [Candidatus Odyssella acanthamoebae]|uniref:Uncharacterized protein n=1 Tax=Candidatus Odyssella acanthamoebae TaxID=91604 RepID=A0A077B1L1_9PROT|nr:hypothetical protein [Candidatus Paracaedibacter acanthamoebae]AIK96820.1 hypothetical protein ID47_08880 [Candidatus Paracaedibacter acanthamoebae]